VLGALATDRRSLVATIRALPPFLVELRGAASRLGATSSLLDDVSSELAPASELVAPALRAVRAAAPQFSGLFHQLPGVFAAGRSGLPAAQAIIRAAGSSFETVYPVSRQVIPLLQLFGALRTNVASFFANLGQFLNGTIATDEGISHGVGGALSVWNETLAGWKVRLPSNRPNPYPRPGSAEEIGNGGLLSYDCTQLHNQLYIPPTGGNGAIPCRLQGPWTFNGKSAYYPRLTLAPP
jgi:ABC-type transporter Mla subunit MlaD